MVERLSPLGDAAVPGRHAAPDGSVGVTFCEMRYGSIVQVAAWPGMEADALKAISEVSGLKLKTEPASGAVAADKTAFCIAPGRWLITAQAEGLEDAFGKAISEKTGTETGLSHGRTAIRIEGEAAEWLLAQFFAIDFSLKAFPVSNGCSANHHDIFAHIQRIGEDAFDVFVFRSFARSFFAALRHAAEERGCAVK